MKVAIEFKHVYKRFEGREKPAVCDANFQVEEGNFVTILGTSGSGKTTLLKMTNGLIPATEGDIEFMGENIKNIPMNEYRRKIGYVIQQAGLFPHKTVYENIATIPKLMKWDKQRIDSRVDELLRMVQLDPAQYRKAYPKKLSGGEQQRVGLARAMAVDPSVMIMDEPFGAIDAITREKLQNELLKIQAQVRKTILFVTHDVQEAFKMGDKVIVMHDGVIQQYDTPFKILFHPATPYVKELMSSGDFFDKLKGLTAESAMTKVEDIKADELSAGKAGGAESLKNSVKLTDNLSTVLEMLIRGDEDAVAVRDFDGKVAGMIPYSIFKSIMKQESQDA